MFVSVEKLSKTLGQSGFDTVHETWKLNWCIVYCKQVVFFDNAFTDMDQHSLAYFAIKLVVYVKIIF